MSYGRYFGELRPGEAFRHWPARTIHEYDDTLLSLLSMNQHSVHPGQHYAQNAQHGCRLVAGPTVISIVIGMTQADIGGGAIETLSYSHIRQTGPVFHGGTLHEFNHRGSRDSARWSWSSYYRDPRYQQETVLSMRRKIIVPAAEETECKR